MPYTEKEYQKYIRLLAWQLLMDSKARELPVRITSIAKLYDFQNLLDYSETRWDNAKVLCAGILDRFGMNYSGVARKQLAVRILSPMCVLQKCHIQYPEDIVRLSDMPYVNATERFARLSYLLAKESSFETEQEKIIVKQFSIFIKSHNNQQTL